MSTTSQSPAKNTESESTELPKVSKAPDQPEVKPNLEENSDSKTEQEPKKDIEYYRSQLETGLDADYYEDDEIDESQELSREEKLKILEEFRSGKNIIPYTFQELYPGTIIFGEEDLKRIHQLMNKSNEENK